MLIAMIMVHHSFALSDGSISASNDALNILTSGNSFSDVDLKVESPASTYYSRELDGLSNNSGADYQIARTDMESGLFSNLDRLAADETDGNNVIRDHSMASSNPSSNIATNLDSLPSGREIPIDFSVNDLLIASSDLASDLSSNLDHIVAEGEYIEDAKTYFWISSSGLRSDTGENLDYLLSEIGAFRGLTRNNLSMFITYEKSRNVNTNLNRVFDIEDDLWKADFYIGSYAQSDTSNLYKYVGNVLPGSVIIPSHTITNLDKAPGNSANLEYKYEKVRIVNKETDINHLLGGSNQVYDIDSNFDYISENLDCITDVDSEKAVPINYRRFNLALNSGSLGQSAISSLKTGYLKKDLLPDINRDIDFLIKNGERSSEHIVPYLFDRWEEEDIGDKTREYPENYAVVVGINSYKDWRGLRTAVNDANEISQILKACGYQVVELTDKTEMKPTKENILSTSLDDLKKKQNGGNIIFYFSGHGIRDDDGTFYLVPQDAKSDDLSTLISELELRGYMRDIDNLAVIIDACNSGDLKIAGDGQLVLTSSKKDETSNEKWFGSLSVFTYNLIKAIDEEMRSSGNVSLSECFYRAREDTIQWSNRRLLSQTPEIIDMTGGNFLIR